MARPRKYYILYEYGNAIAVIEGSVAARRSGAFGHFRTREAAEEHYCWHNFQRHRDDRLAAAARRARLLPWFLRAGLVYTD